jgi:hypothetical protein
LHFTFDFERQDEAAKRSSAPLSFPEREEFSSFFMLLPK